MDIGIGVYTAGVPHPQFIPTLIGFWDENCRNHNLRLSYFSKLPVHLAQNAIASRLNGCDYIMFIEDDTTSIPCGMLDALLAPHKRIIAPRAFSRHHTHEAMAFRKTAPCVLDTEPNLYGKIESVLEPGLQRVNLLHFMCMLVHTSVFAELDYPYFHYGKNGTGTDPYFAENCERNKVDMWVDNRWTVGHCGIVDGGIVEGGVGSCASPSLQPSGGAL